MPPRLIALYALAVMQREGSVHGYQLSERISERTGGAWRPGAGAVYPALRRLVDRGLARREGDGRRRVYRITPKGRTVLRALQRRSGRAGRRGPEAGALWAEIVGEENLGRFLLRRLERDLEALRSFLARDPPASDAGEIRTSAAALLRSLEPPSTRTTGRTRRAGRGHRS